MAGMGSEPAVTIDGLGGLEHGVVLPGVAAAAAGELKRRVEKAMFELLRSFITKAKCNCHTWFLIRQGYTVTSTTSGTEVKPGRCKLRAADVDDLLREYMSYNVIFSYHP